MQLDKPVIGWTGSHSTLKYLDPVVPLLASISKRYGAKVLIICNKPPAFSFPGLVYIPWSEETEVADLRKIHIGLMPLVQDAWSEGKCGFKLIQYLSLGIPAVASPVGINRKIIDQGQNGFLCTSETEWEDALRTLLHDSTLRQKFGQSGREKIIREYSIQANAPVFLGLFD
jgi:glycosyltransferase involved in cell wall biosynthesis